MKKLIFIILIIFTPSGVMADITNTSGNILDGNPVTIMGAGFGSKSTAAPVQNFTFDAGTVGELISETNITDLNTKFRYVTGTGAYGSGNGIKGNAKAIVGVGGDEAYLWYSFSSTQTEVYWSFNTRLTFIEGDTDAGGTQIKWYSVRTNPFTTTSGFGAYPFYSSDGLGNMDWITGAIKNNVLANGTYYGPSLPWGYKPPIDTWFRVELYGKRNSADGVADGTWVSVHLLNGVANDVIVDSDTLITHLSGDTDWDTLDFKHDLENVNISDADVDFYYDNWIVDTTRARVEFGNASTWSACTNRVYQPATEWDATGDRIVVTVEQGIFESGESAWAYVIDSDGNVSTGYPITFAADTNPTVTVQSDFSTPTSPTSYTFSVNSGNGSPLTSLVSSGGFTVTCDDGNCFDEATETGTVSGVIVPAEGVTDTLTATNSDTDTGQDNVTISLLTGATPIKAGYTGSGCTFK